MPLPEPAPLPAPYPRPFLCRVQPSGLRASPRAQFKCPAGTSDARDTSETSDISGPGGTSRTTENHARLTHRPRHRLCTRDGGPHLPPRRPGGPGQDHAGKRRGGAVTVLPGREGGPSGTGAEAYHRNASGIGGAVGNDDRFGRNPRPVDPTRDGRAGLVTDANEQPATPAGAGPAR